MPIKPKEMTMLSIAFVSVGSEVRFSSPSGKNNKSGIMINVQDLLHTAMEIKITTAQISATIFPAIPNARVGV